MKKSYTEDSKKISPKLEEWRSFLLLAIIILPILAVCAIGAYGFFIWFMQLLFWGPPA
ncbi:nitrate reductase [Ignatzschineria larvae DSM 13226]|uniref:Nitrate reductase n=1 Tax=Ignatzschineria larvae DSM 13226 TaxID=1111732 RepID=A0ABZ3C1E6_9GAMM|nr:hypothetical protein [Ignatzschineria larvae]